MPQIEIRAMQHARRAGLRWREMDQRAAGDQMVRTIKACAQHRTAGHLEQQGDLLEASGARVRRDFTRCAIVIASALSYK
jgi:hypothetical protein